jgi:hypothetical protein
MLGAEGVHTTVICPYFIQATGMFEDVNSRWAREIKIKKNKENYNFILFFIKMGQHSQFKWRGWSYYRSCKTKWKIHFDSVVFFHNVGSQMVIFWTQFQWDLLLKHFFNRIVPWGCTSGFLRRLVPDATPQHHLAQGSPTVAKQEQLNINNNNNTSKSSLLKLMTSSAVGERVLWDQIDRCKLNFFKNIFFNLDKNSKKIVILVV